MDEKKSYLAIIVIQAIYTGMFILSKAALDVGMSTYVFVFYRQASATVFLVPIALFLEWKTAPALSWMIFFKIFMLSFFGITLSLNIYSVSLEYTSATLAAATTNTLPVITFFFAFLLRLEDVKLKRISGIAKVAGISVCVGGAATIAFYRGPYLRLLVHHHLLCTHVQHNQAHTPSGKTWTKYVFLMLLSNTFWSMWLVLQGRVLKIYPSKVVCTTLQCFLSAVQSLILAIAMERDPNQWKLSWNITLLSVTYCGIVVTGVTFYLQAWVVEKKGPVFLSMTTPLSLMFTICSSAIFFGEIISLGSLLGGVLLILGLYFVLWGKTREKKEDNDNCVISINETGMVDNKAANCNTPHKCSVHFCSFV